MAMLAAASTLNAASSCKYQANLGNSRHDKAFNRTIMLLFISSLYSQPGCSGVLEGLTKSEKLTIPVEE